MSFQAVVFYVLSAIEYIAKGKRAPLGAFDKATAQQFSDSSSFGVNITTRFMHADTHAKIVIGIFIALMTTRAANDWHALGYVGAALCASGATAMLRQARDEWADVHLKAWPAEE